MDASLLLVLISYDTTVILEKSHHFECVATQGFRENSIICDYLSLKVAVRILSMQDGYHVTDLNCSVSVLSFFNRHSFLQQISMPCGWSYPFC